MTASRIEKLFAVVGDDQKEILSTLQKAAADTLAAYKADNSAARLRDHQAASSALDQMLSDLESRHFGKPQSFANVKEALEFLKAQGYKIAKSKMYADAQRGILAVQEDRSVLESDVLAYAVRAGLEKTPEKSTKVDDRIFADKASAELDLLRAREAKLRFEHEREMGLYLPKADVRAELAMKLGAIEAGVKNLIAVNLVEWIESVGGDPKLSEDLQGTIFEEIDALMNEFCNFDELQIALQPAGPER
ncbi:hypothetical protein [Desulfatitalea tepidiphila]|uniref:hypothetical protein n=1 Tax=Desulfatitalea tepidiphila TaxID=1185843 RepID=UPI0006B403B8|nr:hypothetical protein [Desulfatitalea tepidiphila]